MIRALFLILYNFIRILFHKLRFGKRFQVHPLQRIAPSCRLKLFQEGTLEIGRNTEFAPGCDFEVHGQGHLSIGAGTYFNRYCMISTHRSVKVGEHCMFGPGVRIFDNNHKFSKSGGVSSELSCDEISIGDRCWIASNVIILKGSHIGNNCVIGAGCIISGDVPDGTLVKQKVSQEYIPIHEIS